jgi:hypothetical protein
MNLQLQPQALTHRRRNNPPSEKNISKWAKAPRWTIQSSFTALKAADFQSIFTIYNNSFFHLLKFLLFYSSHFHPNDKNLTIFICELKKALKRSD